MATPGLNVFARFKAKRGMEDRVRAALVDMIDPTLQEAANIGYALHQSATDPTLFLLYEQWDGKPGLENHMSQPYFATMEQRLDGALETPMEVIEAHMIGGETSPAAAGSATS